MSQRLTLSAVKSAIPRDADYFLWDSDLKGFGLKVCKGGRKSYVCKYRVGSGRSAPTRRVTIGCHGSPWTPETARKEALRILGVAATGADPADQKALSTKSLTVSALCDDYLARGAFTKKASTIATDRGRIERHIKPLLGHKKVNDVKRSDVSQFLQDVASGKTAANIKTRKHGRAIVKGGRGTATRTVGLLGGVFSYAVEEGYVETNPVRGVKRFRDRKNDRYLTAAELRALGLALNKIDQSKEGGCAVSIIRLLVFTGARKGEIESLQWSEVDFDLGCLRLSDSKTGQKVITLNNPSLAVLKGQTETQNSPYVFPASRTSGYYTGTPKVWRKVRTLAGLEQVRLHDLRHSFASAAIAEGASLSIVGALLGHSNTQTTAQYAHLADSSVRQASQSTAQRIDRIMRD